MKLAGRARSSGDDDDTSGVRTDRVTNDEEALCAFAAAEAATDDDELRRLSIPSIVQRLFRAAVVDAEVIARDSPPSSRGSTFGFVSRCREDTRGRGCEVMPRAAAEEEDEARAASFSHDST